MSWSATATGLPRSGVDHVAALRSATRSSKTPRPGEFDPERARELGVEFGPDFGRLQRGEVVNGVQPDQVMGETRRGRKVVLTGDTAPSDMTRLVAWEADLLVHEATFTGGRDRARRRDAPLHRGAGR